jgi:hypothetical protein
VPPGRGPGQGDAGSSGTGDPSAGDEKVTGELPDLDDALEEDLEEDPDEEDEDGEPRTALAVSVVRAPGPARRRRHLDPLAAGVPEGRGASRRGILLPATNEGASPQRRFAAAVAQPPADGALDGDAEVLEELATAPVLGIGRVPYASNAVFLLELDAPARSGTGRLRAVYKPVRGERALWDFPQGTLHFRETATYVVDAALRFGLVPPTVLRDGPHGPGSVQLVVDVARGRPTEPLRQSIEPAILQMAALDVLVNNADRKSAHLLVGADGRLWGIDHGLTFLPYPRQRTVLLELGGALLPEEAATAVQTLRDDEARREALLAHLRLLLAPSEVDAFAARLDELADDPVYPELDGWDGRPFEWW